MTISTHGLRVAVTRIHHRCKVARLDSGTVGFRKEWSKDEPACAGSDCEVAGFLLFLRDQYKKHRVLKKVTLHLKRWAKNLIIKRKMDWVSIVQASLTFGDLSFTISIVKIITI
ncbi:MAG: hypothetical protein GYA48_17965 [Chloroflexi bacterium]|nr:hypothetical protein [Chloroflexota bacterium]